MGSAGKRIGKFGAEVVEAIAGILNLLSSLVRVSNLEDRWLEKTPQALPQYPIRLCRSPDCRDFLQAALRSSSKHPPPAGLNQCQECQQRRQC